MFNFDYASANSKALIKELVELGFKHFNSGYDFIGEWRHEPYVFEVPASVVFGLNNKTNQIRYIPKDHLFYYTAPGSEALTLVDRNIKDLESL